MKKILLFLLFSFYLLGENNIDQAKTEDFVSAYNKNNHVNLKFTYAEDRENKQITLSNEKNNLFIIISNFFYLDSLKNIPENEREEELFSEIILAHLELNYKIDSSISNEKIRQIVLRNEEENYYSIIIFHKKTKLYFYGSFPIYKQNVPYTKFFFHLSDNFK